jgi:hypothetical protein
MKGEIDRSFGKDFMPVVGTASLSILKFLVEKYPRAFQEMLA